MVHIYIDAEFDAVRINGRHCQMVVSLGAVLKRRSMRKPFILSSVRKILNDLHRLYVK